MHVYTCALVPEAQAVARGTLGLPGPLASQRYTCTHCPILFITHSGRIPRPTRETPPATLLAHAARRPVEQGASHLQPLDLIRRCMKLQMRPDMEEMGSRESTRTPSSGSSHAQHGSNSLWL